MSGAEPDAKLAGTGRGANIPLSSRGCNSLPSSGEMVYRSRSPRMGIAGGGSQSVHPKGRIVVAGRTERALLRCLGGLAPVPRPPLRPGMTETIGRLMPRTTSAPLQGRPARVHSKPNSAACDCIQNPDSRTQFSRCWVASRSNTPLVWKSSACHHVAV